MLKIRNLLRRQIVIPAQLAIRHGGDQAGQIGDRWAETFEIWGLLSRKDRVLDIGCGPGRMAIGIGRRFGWRNHYLGFDVRAADIEFCRREITRAHRRFRFVHADINHPLYNAGGKTPPDAFVFPAGDSSIDFVFATSVFTHMRTPETLRYLREARRCLAPGGRLLATFFCLRDDVGRTVRAPRFQFETPVDQHCWTAHPQLPEEAVAFPISFLLDAFGAIGFADVQFYPGAWPGIDARHGQDCFVACRGD